MTFKAVFPDILARDRSGHGRPEAIEAVFVLQHTDFANRYQRFTELMVRLVDGQQRSAFAPVDACAGRPASGHLWPR
jgi:hypothetical protein